MRQNHFEDPISFPVLSPRMVPAEKVVANDYNPNRVAAREFELLIHSIREDGVTQPIVTCYDPSKDQYVIIDGFHRWAVLVNHFHCQEVPIVVIDRDISQRMAATVRHNRARGKHQVDLQAELVRKLIHQGKSDSHICEALGMTAEELLRLKQSVGAALLMAAERYNEFYGREDEPVLPPEDEP